MPELVDAVSRAVTSAAERAILPRFRALSSAAIIEKSPGDWVTDADHECEALLTSALASLEPGVPVIGEEAMAADNTPMDLAHTHERVWVIDPVDGTKSFIEGSPDFATMVALVESNQVTASWIWQPAHGRMFTAVRGEGSFENGTPITTPQPGVAPASWRGVLRTRMMPPNIREAAMAGFDEARLVHTPVSAAGVVYPMTVSGELTHALYWRTLPWDHAPGSLLAQEAGLVVARLDGSPYRPWDARFGVLTAANQAIWDAVRAALPDDLPDASTEA
jgi:fructose-1,6-bisphosphatase/inositol monophosphatase family enzyme